MRRAGSLFARLLLAQVALTVLLTATLVLLFDLERNRTVAQLVAARWKPALQQVIDGAPHEVVGASAPGTIYTSPGRPGRAFELASLTPRVAMVREAFADEGVPVQDVVLAPELVSGQSIPVLWLALPGNDGATRWAGFESEAVDPHIRERLVLALLLLSGIAVAASAFVARWLARPLEALRARIAADDACGGPLPHASAEVEAIDEAWRALRQSLEQQERERALLLAGVSHDLRSPLGRIRMAAELLPEGEGIAPRREAIVRNALLADRLVGSFLDHVRSGELSLNEMVDVAAVARSVAAHQQRAASELTVEAPASLLVPDVNAVLIERVIGNLLDNAFIHGRPPVRLTVAVVDHRVGIEVEDCGPGIAPEEQPAMLQAFARGDASRGHPGLGLGLAIVQQVASRLRGRVAFSRSVDGARATVRVEWPMG
jgi:two-component system, OmpR family, osmolarity sensor histidine kinase EnvZ